MICSHVFCALVNRIWLNFWTLLNMTHDREGFTTKYNFTIILWESGASGEAFRSVFGLVPVTGKPCRCCLAIPLEAVPGAMDKPYHPLVSPGAPFPASSLCEGHGFGHSQWVVLLLINCTDRCRWKLDMVLSSSSLSTLSWEGAIFCTNGVSPPAHVLPQWDGCGSASSLPCREGNPVVNGSTQSQS